VICLTSLNFARQHGTQGSSFSTNKTDTLAFQTRNGIFSHAKNIMTRYEKILQHSENISEEEVLNSISPVLRSSLGNNHMRMGLAIHALLFLQKGYRRTQKETVFLKNTVSHC
jgi:hypothetical protein